MNQRIRELAEQATKQVTKPDGHYIVQEWQKVFAELIVQECINELEAHKKCDPYTGELIDSDWNDITQFQIINIKEHFGVEE